MFHLTGPKNHQILTRFHKGLFKSLLLYHILLFQIKAEFLKSFDFLSKNATKTVDEHQVERTNGIYLYRNYFFEAVIVLLSSVSQLFHSKK